MLFFSGCPILGDWQYGSSCEIRLPEGEPTARNDVILLHAARLELKHPIRYDDVVLESPLPEFWRDGGYWTTTLKSYGEFVVQQP